MYCFAINVLSSLLRLPLLWDLIAYQGLVSAEQRQGLTSYFDSVMVLNWVSKPLATEPDDFDDRNELYRMKRDEFRGNPEALKELAQWKAHNHNYEYKLL